MEVKERKEAYGFEGRKLGGILLGLGSVGGNENESVFERAQGDGVLRMISSGRGRAESKVCKNWTTSWSTNESIVELDIRYRVS